MASFNKVILMGNLTRDPELRYTQSNMAVCKVGLAANRRYKDAQRDEWVEKVTFVDVTIFGRRGETFEKYHKKGATAFFEGRLEYDTWDDKNTGQKRSKLYVVADNWEFVSGSGGRESSGGRGGAAGGGYGESDGDGGGDEGGARRQAAPADAGAPQGGYGDYGGASEPDSIDADDTPF
jgi:single-strand DNA-binding protein